jgi:hypothetical protein
VTPSRFIFGWLVHKNRQFLVRHCPLSPQSDSASDSGARTAVNCKPLIIKGNLGLGLIKTSLPLGGVGRAVWPQIVRPVHINAGE